MARCQSLLFVFVIFYNVHRCFSESLQVFVGDPLPFPDRCPTEKPAKVCRIAGHGQDCTHPVAEREGGVWRPAKGYKDRVNPDATFAFKSTVFADTGLYELICDGVKPLSIYVFVAANLGASLTEGKPGTLPCYFSHAELSTADSVLWEKKWETVLKLNLSTGYITYGTGLSEKNVSLSFNGKKDGDLSLIFLDPQKEDGGDYFCSLLKNGRKVKRGDPAAVRMEVIKERDPDQTTTDPTPPPRGSTTDGQSSTETEYWVIGLITAVVVAVVVISGALLFSWLGWCPKPRGTRTSQSSGSSGPDEDSEQSLNSLLPSSPNGMHITKTGAVFMKTPASEDI